MSRLVTEQEAAACLLLAGLWQAVGMFDHVGIFVSDTGRGFRFFEKSLAPLGIVARERQLKWGSIVMSSEDWPPFLLIVRL